MGTHQATGRRLSPSTSHPSPLAQRAFCRQILKVRTVCLNWARTDLCGGRGVIPVSTAIRAAVFPCPTARTLAPSSTDRSRLAALAATARLGLNADRATTAHCFDRGSLVSLRGNNRPLSLPRQLEAETRPASRSLLPITSKGAMLTDGRPRVL